jgi:hypothetical protein
MATRNTQSSGGLVAGDEFVGHSTLSYLMISLSARRVLPLGDVVRRMTLSREGRAKDDSRRADPRALPTHYLFDTEGGIDYVR